MTQTLLPEYFFSTALFWRKWLLKKQSFTSKKLYVLNFKHKIIVFEQLCVLLDKDEEAELILLDSFKHHSVRI